MWFLLDSVKQQIEKAMASGMQFSAEERADIEARSEGFGRMNLSGRTAVIPIEGVLTEKPDFFAAFFGGGNTTYPTIIKSIAQAEASSDVDEIEYKFNTNGGSIDGMFPAMDAMRGAQKPSRAVIGNKALSAGYILASQADKVFARSPASMTGSFGVAMDARVSDDEISIANTESPDKRPDLKTPKGQGVIRGQLDDIYDLAAEKVADGRNTTVKKVNKNFGRGAIVLAKDALEAGMIDGIQTVEMDKPQQTANGGNNTEVRSMDLNQLKTEHPAVFAEAVEVGKKEERDRVNAHLKMGTASGDMATASKAIEDGSELTQSLMATYQAAHMNKTAISDRADDNPDLDATPPPADTSAEDKLDAEIVAAMEASTDGVWLGEGGN
jgi:ClpP class serine protease